MRMIVSTALITDPSPVFRWNCFIFLCMLQFVYRRTIDVEFRIQVEAATNPSSSLGIIAET